LAPQSWLITLPMSASMLGTLLAILPWSWVIQNRGYRSALLSGLALGFAGALLAALALVLQSFMLYVSACFLLGGMAASVSFYVYAATELVKSPGIRRHVIAAVTSAGLASSFLGPGLVRLSPVLYSSIQFAGGFVAMAGVLCLAALAIVNVPLPVRDATASTTGLAKLSLVSWRVLRAGPLYGIVVSASGFLMMTLLMVGAPIAISHDGHGPAVAAGAIQWHLVAMFSPALIAGGIMNRLGASLTATLGVGFSITAIWIAQHAHSSVAYTAVMILCGVGWSFMHTSGTTMVVERCSQENRARVQGLANLVVSSTSMAGSFAAGPLLSAVGYPGLALTALVPLSLAAVALGAGRAIVKGAESVPAQL